MIFCLYSGFTVILVATDTLIVPVVYLLINSILSVQVLKIHVWCQKNLTKEIKDLCLLS